MTSSDDSLSALLNRSESLLSDLSKLLKARLATLEPEAEAASAAADAADKDPTFTDEQCGALEDRSGVLRAQVDRLQATLREVEKAESAIEEALVEAGQ